MATAIQAREGRPSAGRGVALIIRRELGTLLGTRAGWVLLSLSLAVAGILFNTRAVGSTARFSADVLGQFFHDTSGIILCVGFLLALRSVVEERKGGTLALLMNSSLTEGEVIVAKYLGAMAFLALFCLLSLYVPGLVFLRGAVSVGHVVVGYLGLLLYGSAVVAVGVWASAIARGWLVAGAVSGATLAVIHTLWLLARRVDGPLGDLLGALAIHDRHFLPFKQGVLSSVHVLFYLTVTLVFLALGRNGLEARRWTS